MTRRLLRIGTRVLLLLVVLAVGYLAVTFLQVLAASEHDGSRPAQAIVVLGAAQYDGVPSPALANRLDHAAQLYQDGIAPLIVVTGGRQEGDRFTEAEAAANYLATEHGIPGSAIERETTGGNTWESLASTARFLQEDGIDDVVLVTDGYHAMRVDGIAGELGLDAAVSPAPGHASFSNLLRETGAVALGRIIGYDRLVRLDERVDEQRSGGS